jgi:putative ABC transport system ATP-binding protein
MLECRNLSLRLNEQTIISRLNFRISSGEKILLKGPSGSGKTSILHLIMGFIPPTDGELIWKLADYNKLNISTIRRDIAWVPQNFSHLGSDSALTHIDNIFNYQINKASRPSLNYIRSIAELLDLTPEHLKKKFSQLSGGEAQRIAILTAILLNRELTLMDEPTSALDYRTADKAMNLIINSTKALICISHSSDFDKYFNRIINLSKHDEL